MQRHESETIIEVSGLSRRFGRKEALKDISLNVSRGQVFGLVGENGAGKTTLIQHLLGAYSAQQGTVRVFGIDPVYDPTAVLSRIGYVSEDRDIPNWMRLEQLLRYTRAFYPAWDQDYAERLRDEFGLSPKVKVKTLSRGERAKACLLIALAHRPDLLLLDEPSSGLDPVARRDIFATVVRSIAEEGRTVVFSSHLLDEVERIVDHVAMIHQGTLVLDKPMDEVKALYHQYVVRWPEPCPKCPELPGVLQAIGDGREWGLLCEGDEKAFTEAAVRTGGAVVQSNVPTLEAIFLARVAA